MDQFLCWMLLFVLLITTDQQINITSISASSGDSVVLPCRANNSISVLQWIRPDQKEGYLLLFRGGRFQTASQLPAYKNRVELQDGGMEGRDASLVLENVTMEDSGIYQCLLVQKGAAGEITTTKFLHLTVGPPAQQVSAPPRGSVLLPCRSPNSNKDVSVVNWTRSDLENQGYLVLFRDGGLETSGQLPSYRGRVEMKDGGMKEGGMKEGDVSLVLKDVKMEDGGRYKCHIVQDGEEDKDTFIYLTVGPPGEPAERQKEEEEGKEEEEEEEGGMKNMKVPGLVVGSVVVLLVSVLLVLCVLTWRKQRNQKNQEDQENQETLKNPVLIKTQCGK